MGYFKSKFRSRAAVSTERASPPCCVSPEPWTKGTKGVILLKPPSLSLLKDEHVRFMTELLRVSENFAAYPFT